MALSLTSKKNIIFLVKNISIITFSRNMHKSSRRTVNKLLNNNKNNDFRIKRQVKNLNEKRFTMQKSNIRLHRNVKSYTKNKQITDFTLRKKKLKDVETSPINKWQIHRIKTSCQPFRKKEIDIFFNKKILTEIKQSTCLEDMSITYLRKEMFLRYLFKKFVNTSVNIQLDDNSYTRVGASQTGYKISILMQAYLEKMELNKPKVITIIKSIANESTIENFINNISIGIVTPQQKEPYFIELAEHKHLLLIKYHEGIHYVFGYLTSKKTSQFFFTKKYKNFEIEENAKEAAKKENENKDKNENEQDTQHFVLNDPLLQISETSEKIHIVKYSKKYLEGLSENTKSFMQDFLDRTLDVISFKSKTLQAQDGLDICKQYDKDVLHNKKKPPLTKEQEKVNKQENEKKTKEKQKTTNKDSNNTNSKENNEFDSFNN